jgi:phenylalanyl-tRNA synthetase beta chain
VRVPLSWLREYVEVDLEPEALADRLTLLGMEVQSLERWGADWRDVVVGELLAVDKHPRADRLSLTRVSVGSGEPLEIVCGATNIAVGQRVPVALPGAVLPGGRVIERTEKMGVASNGMLCSGDELRLTADGEGILILPDTAPLGTPLVDLYGDWVLDVDVKPNRGDALSMLGLAREVSAVNGSPVRFPDSEPPEDGPPVEDRLAVVVEEPDLCPRFVGRWVAGVRVAPSPDVVQARLLAAGVRPISNVVDASNYVMLELGKPIHTFDAASIHPGSDGRATIMVRRARPGERLETLDHVVRELEQDTLLIADHVAALGIAGVMGGADSEVSERTTDVVVESAIFDPVSIRRTVQRYGLRSEASLRFEKGQEHRLARIGADRTARLLAEWAAGTVAGGRVDSAPTEPGEARLAFRPARINRLLGTAYSVAEQRQLLGRVGIATEPAAAGATVLVAAEPQPLSVPTDEQEGLTAVVPTWRRDLLIEADVAEEVARIAGYETVPSITPHTPMPDYRRSAFEVRSLVRDVLVGAGLTEVVTFALVAPPDIEAFRLRAPVPSLGADPAPTGAAISLLNPLAAQHAALRQGLFGSLLEVVATNLRHGRTDVAVFEIGKGYARHGDSPREWWRLGLALTGLASPPHYATDPRPFDVDDAKGLLELLAGHLGLPPPEYQPEPAEPLLHPGRAARATAAAGLAAVLGEIRPEVLEARDVRAVRVVLAEISIDGLASGILPPVRATPPPRHPRVERDIAVVVSEETPAAAVGEVITHHGGELLRSWRLFDVYRGAPLGDGDKSLAYRLVFGADRTLTDDEIDAAVAEVTKGLGTDIGGRLRS